MIYSCSSEIDWTVPYLEWRTIALQVEREMSELLAESTLVDVDLKLFYCPILMSQEVRKNHPARSRYFRKTRFLGTAPQLDYDRYIAGDLPVRRTVYLDGLIDAVPLMRRAGLTENQTSEYLIILEKLRQKVADLPDRLLEDRSDPALPHL